MIKFYSDEMVPAAVTEGGVDVLTARDAGRLRYPDAAQLAFATEQGRVMITMDEDYWILHSQGQPHAGIAYTPQAHRTFGEMIQALLLIHGAMDPEEMRNRVEHL
ncbi:MAG: DUF5615 family PIN-like protein [Vulcanimicrobiota bacterium]